MFALAKLWDSIKCAVGHHQWSTTYVTKVVTSRRRVRRFWQYRCTCCGAQSPWLSRRAQRLWEQNHHIGVNYRG